jgi:hypothetical protein
VIFVDVANAAFINLSMLPKSCWGETFPVFGMEMVVHVVLVSETPLPATEKENQPIHFVFLLYVLP